jgi:hypothetical protein
MGPPWQTIARREHLPIYRALARGRRLRPGTRKLDQGQFPFQGFGLVGPPQGLFGVLSVLDIVHAL